MDYLLPPDPYAALGLSKDADSTAIKTAYRKLVLKTHPDKFPDPTQKAEKGAELQKILQAYEILGDDLKRQRYDAQVRLAELKNEATTRQKARAATEAYMTHRPPAANYGVRAPSDTASNTHGSEKNVLQTQACASRISDQPKRPSKYYVPGFLGDHYVQANPDTGASHDMISESYAAACNYHIDPSSAGVANLAGGQQAWILGSVPLTFSCILGNGFLKLTKTLSVGRNRLNRIRQVIKTAVSRVPRFHLIGGTQERLQGTVNGYQVCALPDTGADVNIIRRDVAKRLGLEIWSDSRHRKLLELGNGSFVRTIGAAYNAQWCFGPSGSTEPLRCEFQVLDDIPCDVILSNDFLFDSRAFELHEHYFYDAAPVEQLETQAQLNCITEVPLLEHEMDEIMVNVYHHGNEEDCIARIPPMRPPRRLRRVKRVHFKLI